MSLSLFELSRRGCLAASAAHPRPIPLICAAIIAPLARDLNPCVGRAVELSRARRAALAQPLTRNAAYGQVVLAQRSKCG